jgi:hypothetical protein
VFGIEFTWQNKPAEVHIAVYEIYTQVLAKYNPTVHYGKYFYLPTDYFATRFTRMTSKYEGDKPKKKNDLIMVKTLNNRQGRNAWIFKNCFTERFIYGQSNFYEGNACEYKSNYEN